MIGFETIGNAICIVHDDGPVLATDAWISASAYYGSWAQDYEIPPEQLASIRAARHHWFSHGHPDHLDPASLPALSGGRILLPDHRGGRIRDDLRAAGFDVVVLRDRTWVPLSKRVEVCSIANQNQDAILLIRVANWLVVDTNDSPDYGASLHVRAAAGRCRNVCMLALQSWGAVDMINVFDPDGRPLTRVEDSRMPIGHAAQAWAARFGANLVAPFSSFHRYQRADSAWANAFVPELDHYREGLVDGGPEMLPAFIRVDCEHDDVRTIDPRRKTLEMSPPEAFGDSWSEPLAREDRRTLDSYFARVARLHDRFGFLEFVVGGVEHRIALDAERPRLGLRFHCPRASLMHAVTHESFDDLLIANFARVELHGVRSLYPDFSPYVCKYGDNGRAWSRAEVRRYKTAYALRDLRGFVARSLGDPAAQKLCRFSER